VVEGFDSIRLQKLTRHSRRFSLSFSSSFSVFLRFSGFLPKKKKKKKKKFESCKFTGLD
jgi:hypothetical protein